MTLPTRVSLVTLLSAFVFCTGYVVGSRRSQERAPRTEHAFAEGEVAQEDNWFVGGLPEQSGRGGSVTYTDDAIFNVDIPLPAIETIDAKIKFIVHTRETTRPARSLGYLARVRIAALDKAKIPPKYLRERIERTKAGPVTTPPLTQVTYEAQFTFVLLDKDGFTLAEVMGPKHWIESGKTSAFQDVATTPVDLAIVRRVAAFRTSITVVRCLSCW